MPTVNDFINALVEKYGNGFLLKWRNRSHVHAIFLDRLKQRAMAFRIYPEDSWIRQSPGGGPISREAWDALVQKFEELS